MAKDILMPQLSDTMDSGKILSWSKSEGDQIERGDILAEVETDKANLEIEAFYGGVLLKILVPADSAAQVGQAIAVVGEAGESVAATTEEVSNPASSTPEDTAKEISNKDIPVPSPTPKSETTKPPQLQLAQTPQADSGRIKVSPLARKIAGENNINLGSLQGSGPNGRIVKSDIEKAIQNGPAPASPQLAATPKPSNIPTTPIGGGTLTPYSKMRATIARRMQQSVNEAPHFYTTASIRMDQVISLRKVLKEKDEYKGISLNHFIIKAAAYALAGEPRANRAVRDEQILDPDEINVGIITAIDDGLLIPVIRSTNLLSMQDLVFEARAAVDRARAGRPNSSDLTGGTFSISNMGMFDVENFTAIINPGQGAVLAVSSTIDTPIVEHGQIVPAKIMKVTLSVDHRIMDGIISGNFLKFFKEGLENPGLLIAGA